MLQLRKSIKLENLNRPFRQSLQLAAELGAEGVEINGRTELRPQDMSQTGLRQIRKWLADYRLQVAIISYPTRRGFSALEDMDRRLAATKSALDLAGNLGCTAVSLSIGAIPTDPASESYSTLLAALHDLSAHSLKAGAWPAIRTGPDKPQTLAALLDRLPEGAVGVDFDPAELVIREHDAVEVMKIAGRRVAHFRARDAVRDLSAGKGIEVQLGRGSVDFASLLAALEEFQYRGFITAQCDADDPAETLVELREAMEYLDNLFQ